MQIDITPEYLASQGLSVGFPKRFWKKVEKKDGCWGWNGSTTGWGYGKIWTGETKRIIGAHVASWILHRGPIPDGLWVLHECDNPPCSNPEHLFLGNVQTNTWDMIKKGRMRHLFGENIPQSKLTCRQVLRIRWMSENWLLTRTSIAKLFRINAATVSSIVRRRHWKHI